MPLRPLTLFLLLSACRSAEEQDAPAPLPSVPPPIAVRGTAYQAAMTVELPRVPPEEHPELHNVYRLSDNIISGSEPHGEEAFRILQALGVHTILSVDGKVPDAELAARYGMKYVHVPIQYKGIAPLEVTEIAKTFREQEGPFYVHCFHGKHRGPAAAEIGRLVLDGIPRETAIAEMRQWCGTAESYEGLYRTIAEAEIPDAAETRAFAFDFPAAHPFQGFRAGMVEVSRADDNLKTLSKNKWKPSADHPDADAENEATKLASAFERSLALPEMAARPADFQQWMTESRTTALALREALLGVQAGGPTEAADAAYKALGKTCTACHDSYRN